MKIKYTVELDKAKESDALRRMFFWDAVNKKKTFILAKDYTIKTKGKSYDLAPVTVYFLVCKVCNFLNISKAGL